MLIPLFVERAESSQISCISSIKQQSPRIILESRLFNKYMHKNNFNTHDGAVGVGPQACSTAAPQRREQAAGPAPHQRHDVSVLNLREATRVKTHPI